MSEKLRFPDGLVWTECLIGEIKLHFQCVDSEEPSIRLLLRREGSLLMGSWLSTMCVKRK